MRPGPNNVAAWLAFTVLVLVVIGGCTAALWQGSLQHEARPCRESVRPPSPC